MSAMTLKQLRGLIGRRLLNMGARVFCGESINCAEVVASGRVLVLIEIPQTEDPKFDPIASASMATDERGRMRAIIIETQSEVERGKAQGSQEKSG